MRRIGRYEVVSELGRGGMGAVFKAWDPQDRTHVAVKLLLQASDPRQLSRFRREAQVMQRLQHPNVMGIYRVGELDGRTFLVTEYIRGKSLGELELPISWQQAHRMAIELARGLANAHRHGVLHRDIKLANVMVDDDVGDVKILDFSLAKLIRDRGKGKSGKKSKKTNKGASTNIFPATGAVILDSEGAEDREGSAGPEDADADIISSSDVTIESGPPRSADDAEVRGLSDGEVAAATERGDAGLVNEGERVAVEPLPPEVVAQIAEIDAGWREETMLARIANTAEDSGHDDTARGENVVAESPPWLADSRAARSLTQVGALMGTPHYMAPELWHGEQASRASDVYATGIVLYALVTGRTPYAGLSLTELAAAILAGNYRPIEEVAPNVDPRFASIVERCLRTSPAERYTSGEELRSALEILTPLGQNRQVPTGNPYRGLQAFQAEHRSLFFGRSVEIRAVVERLRADSFVLVAGDSGVGKSSLCRAGAVPLILDGAIEPERTWSSAAMMPGRKPLQVLVSVLAGYLDVDEEIIHAMILESAVTFSWYLRKQLSTTRGLVIFIDQLEELVTISDKEQAAQVGSVLAQIAAGIPGVRLLASARGDFLTRVAEIPELGEEISRAIYLLRPLTRAGAREAIAGPAELQGVRFGSKELIEELIDAGVEGSLPLLQFALAELWSVRDADAGVITRADLDAIGGVTGALARHGDGVLASLLPQARTEARRILVRLVTIEDTRANLTEDELTGEAKDARTALEALVRSRLLVVRETADGIIYEIAHEALIIGWGTLRSWLDEEREGRILLHSLETAASEWERLGKPRDALWGTAALTRAGLYLDDDALRPREREFLATSRRSVARGRQLRRAAIVAVPVVLGAVYGAVKIQEYWALQGRVADRIGEARASLEDGREVLEIIARGREEAFRRFDSRDAEGGEEAWAEVVKETEAVDVHLKQSLQALEAAQILDPNNDEARELLAEVLFERALLAESNYEHKRASEFRDRLALYDVDGDYDERWSAAGTVRVLVRPPGTDVAIGRYERSAEGRYTLGDMRRLGETPIAGAEVEQGSYLLLMSGGGAQVRYPVLVRRGEDLEIDFTMPDPERVPEGFVYIPPGRFLFGSADDETMRRLFFYAPPLHVVSTGAYLIGEREVLFADWIEYLEEQAVEDRKKLLPSAERVRLAHSEGSWSISFGAEGSAISARQGEILSLKERGSHIEQDWTKWPVVGLGIQEARSYAEWLDRTGRVTGARLCTGMEWERAVRGADSRSYGHGDFLSPEDANYDQTFGFNGAAQGPTPGGSFDTTRSPFGLFDTLGNAFEWTDSSMVDGEIVIRGGGFPYDSIQARAYNRPVVTDDFRDWSSGLRICAPY